MSSEFEVLENMEIVEEVVETVSETDVVEQVVQVVESIDYTLILNQIQYTLDQMNEYIRYCAGFLMIFIIVLICYFVYKFFRMFF